MKKILVLICTLLTVLGSFAQQRHTMDNLTITIYEPGGQPKKAFHVIVTRTDSAQLQSDVDRTTIRKAKSKVQLVVHEALLQSIVQPYLDHGWQLAAAFVEASVGQVAGWDDHIYRYYLSKQK